jgi:hypothetical protein
VMSGEEGRALWGCGMNAFHQLGPLGIAEGKEADEPGMCRSQKSGPVFGGGLLVVA